jgi:hypothetical protein
MNSCDHSIRESDIRLLRNLLKYFSTGRLLRFLSPLIGKSSDILFMLAAPQGRLGLTMSALDYGVYDDLAKLTCGCGCGECEAGNHKACEFGICWSSPN